MFRYLPSMPTFRTVFFFVINLCWILSEAFSSSIEMFIWFLFFNLLMWYIKLTGLQILKNLCIPGINTSWLWCMILWMYYWICFAVFCWGFLHLCSWVISACKFSFFNGVFVWFWYQGDSDLLKWVWKHFFVSSFLNREE